MTERGIQGKTFDNGHKPNGKKQAGEFRPSKLGTEFASRPRVTLHARRDELGQLAFGIFEAADILFRVKLDLKEGQGIYVALEERDPEPQRRDEGDEGLIYEGMDGVVFVRDLKTGIRKTRDEAAKKRDTHISEEGDPAIGRWYEEIMQRQREKNREVMFPPAQSSDQR